jgi:hypothetical protein
VLPSSAEQACSEGPKGAEALTTQEWLAHWEPPSSEMRVMVGGHTQVDECQETNAAILPGATYRA